MTRQVGSADARNGNTATGHGGAPNGKKVREAHEQPPKAIVVVGDKRVRP